MGRVVSTAMYNFRKRGKFVHLVVLTTLSIFSCRFLQPKITPLTAASESIVINEILYDPEGGDSGYEWIELKNISELEIALEGWSIEVAGASFTERASLPEHIISPGEIILIGEPKVETADIIVPTLSMQNGGSTTDGVRILDPNGIIIDTVLYDTPNENALPDDTGNPGEFFAPDASSGNSLSRISAIDTDNSKNDFVETKDLTPGEENAIPPIPVISLPEEIFAGTPVILDGSDSTSPSSQIIEWSWDILQDERLVSHEVGKTVKFVFPNVTTYLVELTVTDENGNSEKTSVEVTAELDPQNPVSILISEAKDLLPKTVVTIIGTVTAPLSTIYENETYIQDKSGGIRLKVPEEINLEYDQTYLIMGKTGTTYKEPRIEILECWSQDIDVEIIPMIVPPKDITEENLGNLITTELLITKNQGQYSYGENTNNLPAPKIYYSKYLDWDKPEDTKGKYITVTGIVSRYGTNDDGTAKLRVMPRFETDIEINDKPVLLATTGDKIWPYATFCCTVFLVTLFKIQRKKVTEREFRRMYLMAKPR